MEPDRTIVPGRPAHSSARPSRVRVDTTEPFFVVDPDGTVLDWSPSATTAFGWSAEQAVGRRCWQLTGGQAPEGGRMCRSSCPVLAAVRAGGAPWDVEVRVQGAPADRSRAGEPFARRVVLHHVALGEPTVLLHLVDDVSVQRRRERIGQNLERLMDESAEPIPGLTPRQADVFRLLLRGLTTRQVATALGLQHATVRTQIQGILDRLETSSQLSALIRLLLAEESGQRPRRRRIPPAPGGPPGRDARP